MAKTDAIILAGAPADPAMFPEGGPISRAMIPLCGKPMLQWVVDALRKAPSVGRIVAVGDVTGEGLDSVLKPGDDLVSNIRLAMDALRPEEHVLVVSSDIPLLTSEGVEDFVTRAKDMNVDLAYPILPKMHCVKRYPELARTYLKTADGVFTGGNMMLVSPRFIFDNWDSIARAYAARKHVLKLARMIGMGALARVLLGQVFPCAVKISAIEGAVSRMLQARVAAVVSAHPEIGEDVDKPSDLEAVRRIIKSQGI